LRERENRLARLTSGNTVEKTLLWVDPKRCRIWARHNRQYDLLNEKRCADLIEGFKAQGRQEFPAIVRELSGEHDYNYEIICGARRHWTVSYLRENNYREFKFLIEVRELTDEQAFRLSDIENRDREDISDYERALDYKSAVSLYYKSQKQMADRLEVTETWLSRYLDLANLPTQIVSAYADLTHIKVRHAMELKPLLKKPESRQRVLRKAAELSDHQKQAQQAGLELLEGQNVLKALKAAGNTRRVTANEIHIEEYKSAAGKIMATVSIKERKGIMVNLLPASGASKEELIEACRKIIEEFC
jgi:ParB family chromosome partitioning protein